MPGVWINKAAKVMDRVLFDGDTIDQYDMLEEIRAGKFWGLDDGCLKLDVPALENKLGVVTGE